MEFHIDALLIAALSTMIDDCFMKEQHHIQAATVQIF